MTLLIIIILITTHYHHYASAPPGCAFSAHCTGSGRPSPDTVLPAPRRDPDMFSCGAAIDSIITDRIIHLRQTLYIIYYNIYFQL